jgi:hypothetical protein
MSFLILPSRRISQPQGMVEIDWNNPLASGFYAGFANPFQLLGSNVPSPVGLLQPSPGPDGMMFSSNSSANIATYGKEGSPRSTELTLLFKAVRYGAQPDSGFGGTFIAEKVSGIQVAYCHFIKDSGERFRLDTTTSDDSQNIWETNTNWPVGEPQCSALTWASGSEPKIYRNGILQSLSSSVGTISGSLKPSLNLQVNHPALRLNGGLFYLYVFSKRKSSQEISELVRYPWQILRPRNNRIYFDMGAASGGAAVLEGSASGAASASGSLTTGIPIAGAALAVASGSGALSVGIPLAGAAASMSTAAGSLTAQIALTGGALAQAVSSALLSSGITMTAAAVAQAAADGTLVTAIQLLGGAQAQAGASGSLTTSTGGLEGNAQASASASASLSTQIRLSGAAIATAGASGSLGGSANLAGTAVSTASASGELTVNIALTAQALASAIASGSLTTRIALAGDAMATVAAGGDLSIGITGLPPRGTLIADRLAMASANRRVSVIGVNLS